MRGDSCCSLTCYRETQPMPGELVLRHHLPAGHYQLVARAARPARGCVWVGCTQPAAGYSAAVIVVPNYGWWHRNFCKAPIGWPSSWRVRHAIDLTSKPRHAACRPSGAAPPQCAGLPWSVFTAAVAVAELLAGGTQSCCPLVATNTTCRSTPVWSTPRGVRRIAPPEVVIEGTDESVTRQTVWKAYENSREQPGDRAGCRGNGPHLQLDWLVMVRAISLRHAPWMTPFPKNRLLRNDPATLKLLPSLSHNLRSVCARAVVSIAFTCIGRAARQDQPGGTTRESGATSPPMSPH